MAIVLVSPLLISLALLVVAAGGVPATRTVNFPDFVLKYAPLSYLYSKEQYWPADIANHVLRVIPEVNFAAVSGPPTLQTLGNFANNVYLTAIDDVLAHKTPFFTSIIGKPVDGVSTAPATIIVVEKPGGIIDAFYFFFYSFNLGNAVLGIRFGDHVGDWEHTMVRFVNGAPDTVYYSEHASGTAYKYSAVQKIGVRPVNYIAIGTHANYATPGDHNYEHIPFDILKDQTDKGPLWDVTKNYRGFWYDPPNGVVSHSPGAGIGGSVQLLEGSRWLNFSGFWGDKKWPTSRFGQYCVGTECLIGDGPTGPLFKNLGRTVPCQDERKCPVLTSLKTVALYPSSPDGQ